MLHPSYQDLMNTINDRNDDIELKSRYSIVIATSKRAREIIDRNNAYKQKEEFSKILDKPLSKAIEELYAGDIDIKARNKK